MTRISVSRRDAPAVLISLLPLLPLLLSLLLPQCVSAQGGDDGVTCSGVLCGDGGSDWSCTDSGTCTCAGDDFHLFHTDEGPTPACEACLRSDDLVDHDLVVPHEPNRFECRCPVNMSYAGFDRACYSCATGWSSPGGYAPCTCEPGRLKCSVECADTQNDGNHCGVECADPQNDDNNCGACGNRCAVGQTCRLGQCICDRRYFSVPDSTQPGGVLCRLCNGRTTRYSAPGQQQCVCQLGYNNFDPATGWCSPAFTAYPIVDGLTAANDAAGWQFGTLDRRGDLSTFQPFTSFGPAPYPAAASQVNCLTYGGGALAPYACRTVGTQNVGAIDGYFFEAPPSVNLQPSPDRRQAVARFTIPESGTWVTHGNFYGDRRASANVQINRNGDKMFRAAVETVFNGGVAVRRRLQFSVPFSAQAGDVIDFVVSDLGSVGTDWVTLDATVLKAAEQGPPSDCRDERLPCAGKCVNPFRDEKTCGQCNIQCANGERCCDGVCIRLATDRDNCGACGNRCVGATPYCVNGRCTY